MTEVDDDAAKRYFGSDAVLIGVCSDHVRRVGFSSCLKHPQTRSVRVLKNDVGLSRQSGPAPALFRR